MRSASEAGIAPEQFWRMTGWELEQHMAGYAARVKTDMRTASLLAAWIRGAWGGKTPPSRLAPWAWDVKDDLPEEPMMPIDDDPRTRRAFMDAKLRELKRAAELAELAALEEAERERCPDSPEDV